MKKALPKAVLLLLVAMASGSLYGLWAEEKPASAPAPTAPSSANVWGTATATQERATVPGGTVQQPPTPVPANEMNATPTDPARQARYNVPPILAIPPVGPLKPRAITPKDFYLNLVDRSVQTRMMVKFTEAAMIRWRDGHPYSKAGYSTAQLDAFVAAHPELTMRREFNEQTEETLDSYQATAEHNLGEEVANLNNFYLFDMKDNPNPLQLIQDVIKIDLVETAFYQPKGEPATRTCTDIAPTTPDYSGGQTYEGPSPLGVNAIYAGNFHPSGRGHYGAWTCDIEWDWTADHEDFPHDVPNGYGFEVLGGGSTALADHGDACSGIIGACSDGYGMDGESYNVTPKGVSVEVRTWAQAITYAQGELYAGETEFIEIHAYGPDPGYACDATCGNCGQFGYIAIEYWDDNYNAIVTATGANRIVYEAAGNGQMDLSAARYGGRFSYSHDSHAILVGATNPNTQVAECWSNYAFRLDVNGWGEQVYSLGYNDPLGVGDRRQFYTAGFSGTSSATPICTAAGNDLQGISQDKYGITLTPGQMRSYWWSDGTPFQGTHFVGPRPDLALGISSIEPDVYPSALSGWYSGAVVRNVNDATATYAPLTVLDGNTNDTYMNVAGYNNGPSPAPDASNSQVYSQFFVDGDWVWWMNWTPNVGPYSTFWSGNWGPINVRGGRHTTQWILDPANAFPESNENNNSITQQFVWSPLQRTAFNNIMVRSAPPVRFAGNPAYPNGDGFRGSGANGTYWTGFAVLPQAGNDIDAYCYADAYSSTSGFDAIVAASAAGAGQTDLVLCNGNVLGAPTSRLFEAVRYLDGSTADYASEVDASSSSSWYPPFTNTSYLGANEIMDLYEIYLSAGTSYFIGALNITGGLDVALNVYGQGGSYYAVYDYTWSASGNGPNGSEALYITPTQSGWYVAAIMKPNSSDYGVTGNYTFDFESPGMVNLTPGSSRSGWDAAVVARNAANATPASATFPAAITGNTTNYLSATWYNAGTAPTAAAFLNRVLLDNVFVTDFTNAVTLNPLSYSESVNFNAGNIKGGRHTLTLTVDNTNIIAESNEGDNVSTAQYVWSPRVLSRGVALTRTSPPTQGSGTYPNNDGFEIDAVSPYAIGAALLPVVSTADYDMYLYTDYTGTTGGYSNLAVVSAYGAGVPDYVIVPWRLQGLQAAWYPGVINYNGAANNVDVEYQTAVSRNYSSFPFQIPDPDTLGSGNIFNLYEAYLTGGTQYRFVATMLSGAADIEMRMHRDSTTYQYRSGAVATVNAAGPGLSETLLYTPTISDWYALVVSKVTSTDHAQTAIYNLNGSIVAPPGPPMPVTDLVIEPWTPANSVKVAWTHVTQDINGNPLTGRRYVVYRNTSIGIVPVAADSIGGTTDSSFVDTGASGAINFYRVKAKAN